MNDFRLDWDRAARTGTSEAVLCEPKTAAQIEAIIAHAADLRRRLLLTRLDAARHGALAATTQAALDYDASSHTAFFGETPAPRHEGRVVIVAGGTSDARVAREAVRTLAFEGEAATLVVDVGVAGLHRILAQVPRLRAAKAIVVAAGMDGALPSVVAGLVAAPVVAVPTSVGYGAAFEGLAALLTMLNACAPGVAVVNIDNGYGAGHLAAQIAAPPASEPRRV